MQRAKDLLILSALGAGACTGGSKAVSVNTGAAIAAEKTSRGPASDTPSEHSGENPDAGLPNQMSSEVQINRAPPTGAIVELKFHQEERAAADGSRRQVIVIDSVDRNGPYSGLVRAGQEFNSVAEIPAPKGSEHDK